jgi:integrative and conjugative element protein (TIGR02256 family)
VEATGPRHSDKRGRYSYVPDRQAEQKEIVERHKRGLHFVGDWHTHPEASPKPSPADIASITHSFKKSVHSLNAFVLVIVGLDEGAKGIHVSLHDGSSVIELLLAANQ